MHTINSVEVILSVAVTCPEVTYILPSCFVGIGQNTLPIISDNLSFIKIC